MQRLIVALFAIAFLLVVPFGTANAQTAQVVEVSPGIYVGFYFGADGAVYPINKLAIIKPTDPPTPPVPKGTVRAVLLTEAKERTPDQNLLFSEIQSNDWIESKDFRILDDESKDSKNAPLPDVVAALKEIELRKKQLPQIVGFNQKGEVSFVSEVPKTVDVVVEILKSSGM